MRATGPKTLQTKIVKSQKGRLKPKDIQACAEVLENGGLIVFPTDTVYGIGCSAFNPAAIKSIYELKGRHYSKSLPLLLRDVSQLNLVVEEVLPEAHKLMKFYWPGALTLVFKTGPLAYTATAGRSTVAVRVPAHGVVRQILDGLQLPLASTSANQSGDEALTSFEQVKKLFSGRVDLIVDGGTCKIGEPSTVVDATHFPFSILREGAVSRRELAERFHGS